MIIPADIHDPEHQKVLNTLRASLDNIAKINLDAIADNVRAWPKAISLVPTLRDMICLVDLCGTLATYETTAYEPMPPRFVGDLARAVVFVLTTCGQLASIRASGSQNDQMEYNRLVEPVNKQGTEHFRVLNDALAYVRRHEPDRSTIRGAVDSAKAELEHARAEYATLKQATRELSAKTAKSFEEVQQIAATRGVVAQTQAFRDAAAKNASEANIWGTLTGLVAVALLGCVACAIFLGSGPPLPHLSWSVGGNFSHLASRALGVSILSFLMVVCVRHYRSARHNQVTNEHRQHALLTHREFQLAASGDTANRILLHVADAVFSVQPSGYSDKEATVGSTHLAELLAAGRGER